MNMAEKRKTRSSMAQAAERHQDKGILQKMPDTAGMG
jgi:hypothetical protein